MKHAAVSDVDYYDAVTRSGIRLATRTCAVCREPFAMPVDNEYVLRVVCPRCQESEQ